MNLVLNPNVDTETYRHINNSRARSEVLKLIDEDNYTDVFRFLHDSKGFTWKKSNPEKKQARLDFFLVSEESFELVYDCNVVSGYRTDHSGIILKLKLNQNERGKSYWKFNNSLLKGKDYIQPVKKSVEEVKNTYKIANIQQDRVNLDNNNNNNNNNTDNNNIFNNNNNNNIHNTYSINDQLLLEMILLAIRGETIKYSSRKQKENSRQEKQLEDEILNLESKITWTLQTVSQEDINLLNDKKNRLHEIRKSKIEGVMLRSRCRYEERNLLAIFLILKREISQIKLSQ